MPAGGGDAFPVAYGDWDQTYPRWSPDGTRVAFISNRSGNTEIDVERIPGGVAEKVAITERHYLSPMARLHLDIRDSKGNAASARVSVTDAAGRFYAPSDAWISADDSFDRRERQVEAHYFHARGEQWIDVPAGAVSVEVLHGFERRFRAAPGDGGRGADRRSVRESGRGCVGGPGRRALGERGCPRAHEDYGGEYRNTPAHLVTARSQAENLSIYRRLAREQAAALAGYRP